jgi:hypothetical protein
MTSRGLGAWLREEQPARIRTGETRTPAAGDPFAGGCKGILCWTRDLPDKPLNLGPRWTDGGKGGSPTGAGSQDATGDRRTRTSRGEP